jgi:anaerobic magnesium-protoporphyrin IX monomethyl ester cyclase
MVDLLIINPSAAHGITGNHPVYGNLGNELVAVEPPLWARLIAGYIRDRGFSVQIIDAEAVKWNAVETTNLVEHLQPRLICIAVYGHQPSASTQQMYGAGLTASEIKKRKSIKAPIVMVGGHVSALPQRTLVEEDIDYACVGEGPITIHGLLDGYAKYGQRGDWIFEVPGLAYYLLGEYEVNQSAPLLDLKELHGDTWDLLPMHLYAAHNWQCLGDQGQRKPYASVYTTLGCPFRCGFCMISSIFESNTYRMRPPKDVVSEIVMLYTKYGVRTFKIIDEMFVLNERHYTAIAQGLVDSGISQELNIWAYARVDTVKPHTLKMLRKAGFQWLALGIESGSKHVRDGAEKALKSDDIVSTVRAIEQAGIHVIANYIFGLPDDTYETMQETLRLAMELNTSFANFYSAMAYPGSKLYDDAIKNGWRLPSSWRGFSQHNSESVPLPSKSLTSEQILAFRDAAFLEYFSNPVLHQKLARDFGMEAVKEICKMTTYKLERNLLKEKVA